jgi:cytosine/adenosine deaminase-related metal-dependent hydrolase
VTDAGRINAHTHIYSGLAPFGMPQPADPPENFVQILERVWWRLDRALDPRSLAASARWYVAEALLSGTTTLVDHHESPDFIEGSLDVLADACDELGMRALLCYGATERNAGRDEARRGLAECRRFLETNRRPHVRGVVGLHASFTVSDATIREAGALCRELGTVLHVHVAEDRADVEDAKERGFAGPLERLHGLGALPAGSILAHGVWLEPDEVRLAWDLGCWIVQNPRSNRGNRVGYPRALGESDRVALGTDGYPSDLDEEARALRDEARAHGEDEAVVRRRADAAPRLVADRFGPNSLADDRVVREGGRVHDVTVAGRTVVREGRLLTGDREAIAARARAEAPRLWQRMLALRL